MSKIKIDLDECIGCGKCVEICPNNVYELKEKKPLIANEDACALCGICADQCPKNAIELEMKIDVAKYKTDFEAKDDYKTYSDALHEILNLRKSPVSVKLIKTVEDVPSNVMQLEFPVRHCVSINMAAHGAVFYLPPAKHACAAAKACLGMAELPEKVKNGTIPFMHGLAATQESAARIMSEIPKLPLGSTQGTLLAPLEKTFFEPDVVILTVVPKQAMWIANAMLFETGSPRVTANFAGMQASCGDVTAIPILKGEVNFSVGCYGCRSAGKLADEEMYVGIPIQRLGNIVNGLRGLRKAMSHLTNER
jgi:uncharacterized protein (DUF169 family)/NAD-dependent dihydropyrimidine dehydrogenase PreA subunit